MSATIELTCNYCRKVFRRRSGAVKSRLKNEVKPKFYCSLKCVATKGTTVTIPCANCFTPVTKVQSIVKRSKTGNVFCTRSCSVTWTNKNSKTKENHPNWTDGKSSYRRGRMLTRCALCPETRYYLLTVHHKDGDRANNEPENLADVCANCHILHHLVVKHGRLTVRWGMLTSPEARELIEQNHRRNT